MSTCCIKECEKKVLAHDMCSMHWQRFRLHGSPLRTKTVQYHGLTPKERFLKYVDRPPEGCWPWKGGLNGYKGYGMFNYYGRPRLASRVSWMLFKGDIPDGLFVCHACDNPKCVNPDHLFLGSQKDNMDDMVAKGRSNNAAKSLPGVLHGGVKLTDADVLEIRSASQSFRFLARRYGVSTRTIGDVKSRRSWKHVP